MTAVLLEAPRSVVLPEIAEARAPRWPWLVAAGAYLQYIFVAVWLVNVQGYLLLDGASRTITAQILVRSRDPHLGAMGFYWPPLPMLVRVPFVLLLAPVHQTLFAGAISTCLLSALVIPVLAAIAKELQLSTAHTALLIALYALNPVVIFYAANGMSEAAFSLCLSITFLGYIRFSNSRSTKDMRLLSVGLALGMMSRIEFIPITFAVLLACALLLPRDRWKRAAVLIALPPFYVFVLWSWASSLLQGDAFYWYHFGKASGATPDVHPWLPDQLTLINILWWVLRMSLVYAPVLAILFLSGAMIGVDGRRWLGMMLMSFVLPAFIALQLIMHSSVGAQRYFSTLAVVGVVAAMWTLSATTRLTGRARLTVNVLVIGAVVSAALGVVPVNADRYQSSLQGDSVFFAPLLGREPYPYPKYLVGMQTLVDELDKSMSDGQFVAMDSQGGLPLFYTKHPERFILPEDRDFEQIISDPEGRFTYVIRPDVGLNSSFRIAIDRAMNSMQRGKFVLIKKIATAELWKYEPNPEPGANSTIGVPR
jgi:hypothetical protein